ncbi:MAG: hypothetical protein VX052_03310 [Candidatus Thermoplasmatota archaeon]|nr:hypothetical protein [Candidatus Thermoplasmatota archaeon]
MGSVSPLRLKAAPSSTTSSAKGSANSENSSPRSISFFLSTLFSRTHVSRCTYGEEKTVMHRHGEPLLVHENPYHGIAILK